MGCMASYDTYCRTVDGEVIRKAIAHFFVRFSFLGHRRDLYRVVLGILLHDPGFARARDHFDVQPHYLLYGCSCSSGIFTGSAYLLHLE